MRFEISNLRLVLLAVAVLFLSASTLRAQPEAGQVSVHLSAVDKEGRPVEGLKPEDLRVTVEDAEQKVLSLSSRTEEPLHVVIMLDASASQEKVLPFAQGAADRLVPPLLLRPNRNDAAVVSFTGYTTVVQDLTADAAAVRRAIAAVEFVPPPGYIRGGVIVGRPNPNDPTSRAGQTAIWEALILVCDEVFARAKTGRRAVVLVSDGVDTSSRVRLDQIFERLLRDGVAVYVIGIADESSFDPVNKSALRKLSERTGGRAIFPKKAGELPVAFEQVRRELLNTYALTFDVPATLRTGKPLKLRVEVVNPALRRQGVQLAHPQSLLMEPGRQ
jgi:VWFA-related protein